MSANPFAAAFRVILATVLLSAAAAFLAPPPASGQDAPIPEKLYIYASVGDNQWVSDWWPLDSQASIDGIFDWLRETYGADRMYWRGEQDRMWLENYTFRKQIPLYYDWWQDWLRYLTNEVKTDDLAVQAARRTGMEIYIFEGLLEHACQGDAGGCGMFPYQCEDNLRIEHPEWCPVDRWGERYAPGPIEFCYPEARKALLDRYVHYVVDKGYDGISFYTYVENMGVRYLDEFGFNEPIVQEFQKRYGVDIRTEPFDKEAWYKLRGEYLTEFLRELHTVLSAKGKKLSMTLQANNPRFPEPWYGTQTGEPDSTMFYLDWEGWVREGIVDELVIWNGADKDKLLAQLQEACAGKPVELVVLAGTGAFVPEWINPFIKAGCTPLTVAANGQGPDRLSRKPTSLETLSSPDWMVRAQTLADIAAETIKADGAAVAPLAKDPHALVRRQAVIALGALKAADQVAVIESALLDPESSVRIQAGTALSKVNGPQSAERIMSALASDGEFQMKMTCINALTAMQEQAMPALVGGLRSPHRAVREVCVLTLGQNGLPGSFEPLLNALATDPDYRVRFYAIGNPMIPAKSGIAGHPGLRAARALVAALRDPEPTVQAWAAKGLGDLAGRMSPRIQQEALAALEDLFRQFGDGCTREDAAWGWRPVGNALLAFGQSGKDFLEAARVQTKDRWLAWAAYQVVYVPQDASKVVVCTEEEAIETHAKYAPPFPGWRR